MEIKLAQQALRSSQQQVGTTARDERPIRDALVSLYEHASMNRNRAAFLLNSLTSVGRIDETPCPEPPYPIDEIVAMTARFTEETAGLLNAIRERVNG